MPLDRPRTGSDWIAPDCAGMDFHAPDHGLRDLLAIYLPADVLDQLTPHYQRLGQLAGGRLDELARLADRHPPVPHPRDRFGRDLDWIEYHPAYREMEQIALHQRAGRDYTGGRQVRGPAASAIHAESSVGRGNDLAGAVPRGPRCVFRSRSSTKLNGSPRSSMVLAWLAGSNVLRVRKPSRNSR